MEGEIFKVSVRALVHDGKNVLLAREEWENAWETPGAKLCSDASVLDCLRREVLKKTGYEVFPEGVVDFPLGRKQDKKEAALHLVFKCRLGDKKGPPAEGVKTKWFAPKEIKELLKNRELEWHDERVLSSIP